MAIHWIDLMIFVIYLVGVLGIGFYFLNKNKSKDDYYVGGRSMSSVHVGLSVVATDVGGGFSIGLGGLGFIMGLSGSWMLFTGLLGAWISAVLLIPRVYPVAKRKSFLTFPQALNHFYNGNVAYIAGIIALIGYIGFTSSQILAGAKLASATFPSLSIDHAILAMGIIAVVYTVVGGIKAVIYTDTVQWILLMGGLILIGIPLGYQSIGGWEAIKHSVHPELFSLTNISFVKLFNWLITILPIWFVGMTLYQRIYACKDVKTAKRAWYIAGVFEYPLMAFMGVVLGLFAKIAFDQGMFESIGYIAGTEIDAELGLPLLLRTILPVGLMGVMMAAYFSAIMSTADSCLMAASGNFTTDVVGSLKKDKKGFNIRFSQLVTLSIGAIAIFLASTMENVLELMLYSYAFMVSGLLVPVLGFIFLKKPSAIAAMVSMILGGLTTLSLIIIRTDLPYGLDANFFGISLAAVSFLLIHFLSKSKKPQL